MYLVILLGPKEAYLNQTKSVAFTFGWKLDVSELQFIDFEKKSICRGELIQY